MDIYTIVGGIAIVSGFYMAWSIGANDVSNAMGTSVGSKALTLKQAVIIAAFFEFAGAFLVGSHVTDTIRKGMVDPSVFSNSPEVLMLGMLSALLAAAVWLQAATHWGLPVSTTHSIVGAVVGFALVAAGADGINWSKVWQIVASWVISPVMGGVISATVFIFVRNRILDSSAPIKAVKKNAPYLIFVLFSVLTLSMVYKGLKNLKMDLSLYEALGVAIVVGGISAAIGRTLINRVKSDSISPLAKELSVVESVFRKLQIITACYMAFAHGANDVANAIGPLAAIFSIIKTRAVSMQVEVPIWILGLGGVGIVIGLATWGYKIIETVGKKITELTPSRGFSAEFGAATTVLVCSKMGMPI
jgi:PiT family inorganic phosphate transporter